MNRFEKQITGIFPSTVGNMCFLADGFSFTIMDNQIEPLRRVEIEPQDSFLRGKTRDGYDIGVYIGNHNAEVYGGYRCETGAYVVSINNMDKTDISDYYGIEFVGGTLNKLYRPHFKNFGVDEQEDEKIEFSIIVHDITIQIEIGYSIIFDRQKEEHTNEEAVYCRMTFLSAQNLGSFFQHYNALKELISFMAYRQNVGFDDIYLLSQPKIINGIEYQNHLAAMFIYYDNPLTEKDSFTCIHFHEIKPSLASFLTLLYNNEERKPLYSSGYIPQDDHDAFRMTNSKVREICSAIECELYHVQVCDGAIDSNLRELIDSVKERIKEHQNSDKCLPDKMYNNIYGSLQNWDIPASERIIALYQKHEGNVVNIRPVHFFMNNTSIEEFIKYRNDITHGRYRQLNKSIAKTGFALIGLIYCCVLSRIGLNKETIDNISKKPRLLS